jgi:hypothetical protein
MFRKEYSPSSCSENASGKLDPLEDLKKKCFIKFPVIISEISTFQSLKVGNQGYFLVEVTMPWFSS